MQTWPQPVKLTTTGPMFRYDRPQAGRYRQFWQFDVEAIGDAGPGVDAEIIELGTRFYAEAGVDGRGGAASTAIGDPACRPGLHRGARRRTTAAFADRLPPTELDRLERNALRLLDSKDPAMAELNAGAPRITDRLCEACAAHFECVKAHLSALGVPFRVEPGLVRGLDYYTRTAFEYYVAGREGQQQALGGGGRYDGLVAAPGRQADARDRVRPRAGPRGARARRAGRGRRVAGGARVPLAVVVGADPEDTVSRLRIATELRAAGLRARADLARRKLGRQLEAAGRDGAHFAVIVGRRAGGGPGPGPGPPRRHAAGGGASADLARELARADASHRHG